ncbi:MAG: hemin uptake protein HemP [Variibacter sp.]
MSKVDPAAVPPSGHANRSARQTREIPISNDRIESHDLFVGTREIIIGHGEDAYRLRLTAQNKLILTK